MVEMPTRTPPAAPAPPILLEPADLPTAMPVTVPEPPPRPKAAARPSPAMAQVLGLLRSPRTLGAAFFLREILDPPLVLRRGPGGR
jgi:hypothetical protein